LATEQPGALIFRTKTAPSKFVLSRKGYYTLCILIVGRQDSRLWALDASGCSSVW